MAFFKSFALLQKQKGKRKLCKRWTECFFPGFRHMLRMRMGEYIGNDGHKSIEEIQRKIKRTKLTTITKEIINTIAKRGYWLFNHFENSIKVAKSEQIENSWKDWLDEAWANFIESKRILPSLVSQTLHSEYHCTLWDTAYCTSQMAHFGVQTWYLSQASQAAHVQN